MVSGSPLLLMMRDQFANYVVQRMLDVAEGEILQDMINQIRPHQQALMKFNYGKRILCLFFEREHGV